MKEFSLLLSVTGNNLVFLLFLLGYLIFYFSFFTLLKPYDRRQFYVLEFVEKRVILIQISNASFAALWIATIEERNIYVSWFIFIYVVLFNLLFLGWWIYKYQGFMLSKLRAIKMSFVNKFMSKKSKSEKLETEFASGYSKQYSNSVL